MTTVPGGNASPTEGLTEGSPGASVVEWRRYGHHRAYAALPDGTKLGYRCLATDTDHPTDPAFALALTQAIEAWLGGPGAPQRGPAPSFPPIHLSARAGTPPRQPAVPTTVPADLPTDLPTTVPTTAPTTGEPADVRAHLAPRSILPVGWTDLALNEPGAAPRAMARARKEEQPGWSAVGRLLGVHTQERAWRVGARGEQLVAAQLAKVVRHDPRWRLLHSVPVGTGDADIDHVVIGPGGVFTINAHHHAGKRMWVGGDTVMVNGLRVPHVRKARHEARRATRLLSLATGLDVVVTAMVVPAKLLELVVETPPADVVVLHRHALARWLREQPAVYEEERVELIHSHARRSSTWAR